MTRPVSGCSGVILLIEDNPMDVVLARQCFEESAPRVVLHHVENGNEALTFLRREDRFADAPVPDLLLLDLNMPMMDGRQLLAELVADQNLRHFPVVVLTNSASDEDILHAHQMHANSYIRKPVDFDEFADVVTRLVDYWFNLVQLPHNAAARVRERMKPRS